MRSRPVVDLDLDDADEVPEWSGGALLIARRGGIPVGSGLVEGPSPASAEDAVTLLEMRKHPLPPPASTRQGVTVAVCTRNRPEQLARCLDAVTRSIDATAGDADAEIVVVDNAPVDDRAADVALAHGARYVCEPIIGLNVARNRAVRSSTREVIAFVDDDVVVDRCWMSLLCRALAAHPDAGAVVGGVLAYSLDTPSQLEFERSGGFFLGWRPGRRDVQTHRDHPFNPSLGVGCNMAFRHQALVRAGPFDEVLDTPELFGGGDLEMLVRVAMIAPIEYEPSALVFHEHRRTARGLVKQYYTWGKGWAAVLASWHRRDPHRRRVIVRAMLHAIGGYGSSLLGGRRVGGYRRRDALVMVSGFAAGATGAYGRSRRQADRRRAEHVRDRGLAAASDGEMRTAAAPRISVVLPFLNEERFLAGAIDTVFEQSEPSWELLLVDDGSTDASARLADELAARRPDRVRVLRHRAAANRGLPASRNLGLSQARGALIAFIDADDRWEPFKLAEQAALFRQDPELAMVCGPTLYQPIGDGESTTLTPVMDDAPRRLATGEFAKEMVRGTVTPPPPSNVMFRAQALRLAGGVPDGDSLYEDQRTFVAVSLIGSVLVADRVWSSYTIRPDSLYGSLAHDYATRLRQQRDFHRWILRWAPRRGSSGRSLAALLISRRLHGAVRRRVIVGTSAVRRVLTRHD